MMETKKQDVISSPRPGQIPTTWNQGRFSNFDLGRTYSYFLHCAMCKSHSLFCMFNLRRKFSYILQSKSTITCNCFPYLMEVFWFCPKRKWLFPTFDLGRKSFFSPKQKWQYSYVIVSHVWFSKGVFLSPKQE